MSEPNIQAGAPRAWDTPSRAEQHALELIQEAYRKGHLPQAGSESDAPPSVPHPSEFQVDPLVIGGGIERALRAREAKRLLDLDPATKAETRSITFGPTEASMDYLSRSGLDMGRFGGTTLMGITDLRKPATVGIQDRSPEIEAAHSTLGTLAHEIGHAAGRSESAAQVIGGMTAPLTQEHDRALMRDALIQQQRGRR